MKHNIRISIYEVVGSELCLASSDGQKVYDRISHALESNSNVELCFLNVSACSASFLNAAVGQLYGRYDHSVIKDSMSVVNAGVEDLEMVKIVVDNSKRYFKDKEVLDATN